MPKHAYEHFFPFSSIRAEQRRAIEFALDSYESGKKYVILELATGCGKSAIGITISRYLAQNHSLTFDPDGAPHKGSYVLTTQKILQKQYLDDFGPESSHLDISLLSIKSSNNYRCGFYEDQSCAESRRVLTQLGKKMIGTGFFDHCRGGSCQYAIDKQAFLNAKISLTNFAYFFAETTYGKQLKNRKTLVIDEAHNIENELGNFVEITFSTRFAKDILKCKRQPQSDTQQDVFKWLKSTYRPALVKHTKTIEAAIQSKVFDNNIVTFSELSKQYEMLDKHTCKISRFLESYDTDNWVMNTVLPVGKAGKRYEFKPVDVSSFAYDSLFKYGEKVLLMSATIVDKETYCKSIGLDPAEVAMLAIGSPFPIENRQIHYLPIGSMSKKNVEQTIPILASAIKELLEQHKTEKGIIHCVSNKVANYIFENVNSPRLLVHDSTNRDEILRKHIESVEPTVLLSPSMTEGVDLADDSSRFQILCKIPFPYLGDEVIKRRMNKNASWYPYQTAKSIIQSLGRSIRNYDDHAVSYILDSDWEYFYKRNKKYFPNDFSTLLSQ